MRWWCGWTGPFSPSLYWFPRPRGYDDHGFSGEGNPKTVLELHFLLVWNLNEGQVLRDYRPHPVPSTTIPHYGKKFSPNNIEFFLSTNGNLLKHLFVKWQVQSDRGSFWLHHWGQIPAEISLQWRMVCILLNLKILTLTNFDYLKHLSQWWPGGTSRVVQSFSTLATRGWSRLLLRTGWSAWHGQGFSPERHGWTWSHRHHPLS